MRSLESVKIVIGSLESEKIGSLESEKSGPYRSMLSTRAERTMKFFSPSPVLIR